MKIIMLGAPGAGKGTQAKKIADKYQIPHISTGDIFRANIKNGTELGMEAKSYMDQGKLVPDELTVKILLDRVAQADCANGYVLDGFPRTIPQAEVLDKALAELNDKIDYAINVDVPDENIIRRMSGRRACVNCGATYHIEHVPEPYAAQYHQDRETAVAPYVHAAVVAHELGLGINAGHDLDLHNLAYFHECVPYLDEVSIGHALICDALYLGLEETIKRYLDCLK